MLTVLTNKAKIEQRRRDRSERIRKYWFHSLYTQYDEEAKFLENAKSFLEMFEEMLIIREAQGTKNGIADLLLCYRGRFVAPELKAINGVPSSQQLRFIENVHKAGGIGGICSTLQDIWDLLEQCC